MERSVVLTEEDVTKQIIKWLLDRGWAIVTYDFPQSGTGRQLHPNNTTSKTEGIIIPDIVAHKRDVVLYFENKDRFVLSDFVKLRSVKNTDEYSNDWAKLLKGYKYRVIYYGIGIPFTANNLKKAEEYCEYVDYVAFLRDGGLYAIGEHKEIIEI